MPVGRDPAAGRDHTTVSVLVPRTVAVGSLFAHGIPPREPATLLAMTSDADHQQILMRRATQASLAVAVALLALKLVAWHQTGSVAMLASATDSVLDALASPPSPEAPSAPTSTMLRGLASNCVNTLKNGVDGMPRHMATDANRQPGRRRWSDGRAGGKDDRSRQALVWAAAGARPSAAVRG